MGSAEPGSQSEIKLYQQTSTKHCTATDLEIDGLYHVGKSTNVFLRLT